MNYEELFIEGYELPRRLSKLEIDYLIEKTRQGDYSSREELIKHNLRLVIFEVTTRFKNVEYEKKI